MPKQDELQALRWELDQIMRRVETLSSRLSQLEGQAESRGTLIEPVLETSTAAPTPVQTAETKTATPPMVLEETSPLPPPLPAGLECVPPPLPVLEENVEAAPPLLIKVKTEPASRPQPPSQPLTPQKPSIDIEAVVWTWLKSLGPKEAMSWEMAVGTYWLPRVGLVVLAIGVVWLASLAIQKLGDEWMPFFRVGLGYAICGGLLGAGKWLERKAPQYARLLLGGGLALTYFVTYATYFIPYSRVLPHPAPCLVLLSLIVMICLALTELWKSRVLALGMLALGHLTVAISTLMLPEPVRLGVLGLVALSVAAAFFLLKNHWYTICLAGMVGSYLNYTLWLANASPSGRPWDLAGSLGVLTVYFAIFALAELFAPETLRRREAPTWLRSLFVSINTASFLVLGRSLALGFDFSRDSLYLFYFALGLALLILGLAYLRRRAEDPLFNAYLVKASVVVTMGLAAYFDGAMLTMSLAIEAVVLLLSARRSGMLVTRMMVLPAAALALIHGLYTVVNQTPLAYADPAYMGMLVPSLLTLGALLFLAYLYQRTDWTLSMLAGKGWPEALRDGLWTLDFVQEPATASLIKPLNGLLIPAAFAAAAGALGLGYAWVLLGIADRGPVLAIAGVGLALLATILGAAPISLASLIFSAGGCWYWLQGLFTHCYSPESSAVGRLWYAGAILLPLMVLSEIASRGNPRSWWTYLSFSQNPKEFKAVPYVYALTGSVLGIFAALLLPTPHYQPLALGLGALAGTIYAGLAGAPAIGLAALPVLGYTVLLMPICFWKNIEGWTILATLASIWGTALGHESRYVGTRPGLWYHQHKIAPYFLYGVAVWALAFILATRYYPLPQIWLSLGAAVILLGLMNLLHPESMGVWATFMFYWTGMLLFFSHMEMDQTMMHAVYLAAPGAALLADRYLALRGAFLKKVPGALLVVLAWFQLFCYDDLAAGAQWRYFGGALITFFFFAYALPTQSRTALAVALLGSVFTTLGLVSYSYERSIALGALIAGYGGMILFYMVWERAYSYAALRFARAIPQEVRKWCDILFVAVPSVLVLTLLERIPLLHDFYLTISWTIAAVALFGVSFVTRQSYYRYAGLLTFGLVLCRAFLIDTSRLEPAYRVAGVIFLGMVLLAVAYGYIRWRENMRRSAATPAVSTTQDPEK